MGRDGGVRRGGCGIPGVLPVGGGTLAGPRGHPSDLGGEDPGGPVCAGVDLRVVHLSGRRVLSIGHAGPGGICGAGVSVRAGVYGPVQGRDRAQRPAGAAAAAAFEPGGRVDLAAPAAAVSGPASGVENGGGAAGRYGGRPADLRLWHGRRTGGAVCDAAPGAAGGGHVAGAGPAAIAAGGARSWRRGTFPIP